MRMKLERKLKRHPKYSSLQRSQNCGAGPNQEAPYRSDKETGSSDQSAPWMAHKLERSPHRVAAAAGTVLTSIADRLCCGKYEGDLDHPA